MSDYTKTLTPAQKALAAELREEHSKKHNLSFEEMRAQVEASLREDPPFKLDPPP